MELDITWDRVVRVWWALLWRNLIAVVAAVLIGSVIGGIIGVILGMAGVPVGTIRIIVMPIGIIIGFAVSIVPLKMILGKDFGDFRLVPAPKQ
jgi:hypothetical protein